MPGMNGEPTAEELQQYILLLEAAKSYLRTFSEQISTEKRMEHQKEFLKLTETFRGLPLINASDEPLNCAVGILRNSPPSDKHTYAAVQTHLTNAITQLEVYRKAHRELNAGAAIRQAMLDASKKSK